MYINKNHSNQLVEAVANTKEYSVENKQLSFNNFSSKYVTANEEYSIQSSRNFINAFNQSKIIDWNFEALRAFQKGVEYVRFQLYSYDLRRLNFNVPFNIIKNHKSPEHLMDQYIKLGILKDKTIALSLEGNIHNLQNNKGILYLEYDIFANESRFDITEKTNQSTQELDRKYNNHDELSSITKRIFSLYKLIKSNKLDFSNYAELTSYIHKFDTFVAKEHISTLVDRSLLEEEKGKSLILKFDCNNKNN